MVDRGGTSEPNVKQVVPFPWVCDVGVSVR